MSENAHARSFDSGDDVQDKEALSRGLLDAIPESLPALTQAQEISCKAVASGFEWEKLADVWAKVSEEKGELDAAYEIAPKDESGILLAGTPETAAAQLEFGDLLFTLVNVARKMGIDAEEALLACCAKFRGRWSSMEHDACEGGFSLEGLSVEEYAALWRKAKERENIEGMR